MLAPGGHSLDGNGRPGGRPERPVAESVSFRAFADPNADQAMVATANEALKKGAGAEAHATDRSADVYGRSVLFLTRRATESAQHWSSGPLGFFYPDAALASRAGPPESERPRLKASNRGQHLG
jgi:hypothetical protein